MRCRSALITGICGQDGIFLSKILEFNGYKLYGTTSANPSERQAYLRRQGVNAELYNCDLASIEQVSRLVVSISPDVIFHFAGLTYLPDYQSDPIVNADVSAMSCLRFLEAISRHNQNIRFVFASSAEVFGNVSDPTLDETSPLIPSTPYGISKLFAQSMTAHYRDIHNLHASSAILFNHESYYRPPHFVSRKITNAAVNIKLGLQKSLILGNLDVSRDWGYAYDYAYGMYLMSIALEPADFVFSTGHLHTVRDLCHIAFSAVGLNYLDYVVSDKSFVRSNEPLYKAGCSLKAYRMLNWGHTMSFKQLIEDMVEYDLKLLTNK